MRGLKTTLQRFAGAGAALIATAGTAMASTGGGGSLPWDGPIQTIEQDLSGNVAHMLIIVAIVATGLMWAFGEHGSSMRKVMGIAAGGSIALGATSLITGLGLGSGAVIGGVGPLNLLLALPAVAIVILGASVVAGLFRRRRPGAARPATGREGRNDIDIDPDDVDRLRLLIEARRQRQKEWRELREEIRGLYGPAPMTAQRQAA